MNVSKSSFIPSYDSNYNTYPFLIRFQTLSFLFICYLSKHGFDGLYIGAKKDYLENLLVQIYTG